jgi:hypothetical protein
MLWGLPEIRHKSVKLACTVLRSISTPSIHSKVLPSSGSAPHHILHEVYLEYLDEMQDTSI